jgi:hypothetical protein
MEGMSLTENHFKEQIVALLNQNSTLDELANILQLETNRRILAKARNTLKQIQPVIMALHQTKEVKQNRINETVIDAVFYLFSVEVSATLLINFFTILMHAKGIDPNIPVMSYGKEIRRHATSLEDLESTYIPLTSKLEYLKYCKFPYFENYIDTNLRNKIAHMDFEIRDNGDFFAPNEKTGEKEKIDIKKELYKLFDFNSFTMHQIAQTRKAVEKRTES